MLDMNLYALVVWATCRKASGKYPLRFLSCRPCSLTPSYCNMDYIFFSAIVPVLFLSVIISYDIACQWKLNLPKRIAKLPEHLRVPLAVVASSFLFGIPKFHAPAHSTSCAIPHSLNLMPGVGRTDGEGIERNWSEINRVTNSTKEMGPGARHDTLDDHFGHHNFRKLVGLGKYQSRLSTPTLTATKDTYSVAD